MKPEEIESITIRQTGGRQNYSGQQAVEMAHRFGVDLDAQGNFDCDARAKIARRMAEKAGYSVFDGVQQVEPGKYHKYLKLRDKNGILSEILKHP